MVAAFVRLSRLKFLAGGFVCGGLGTAVAAYEGAGISWSRFALAQTAITALQLMTHYANDFFDRKSDALAVRTPFSGGSGVLVDGSLPPHVGLRAALICLTLGLGAAAGLLVSGRPAAAAVACAIAILAWSYSAPPLRLLARGLGELDTAVVVCVLVPLCAFAAQTARLDLRALGATLPVASAMGVMMLSVEFPDVEPDAATGKRNLVVRLGREGAGRLVRAGLWATVIALGAAVAAGAPPTLIPLLALGLPAALGIDSALRASLWTHSGGSAEIAARGVGFFFVIALASLLGFVVALP